MSLRAQPPAYQMGRGFVGASGEGGAGPLGRRLQNALTFGSPSMSPDPGRKQNLVQFLVCFSWRDLQILPPKSHTISEQSSIWAVSLGIFPCAWPRPGLWTSLVEAGAEHGAGHGSRVVAGLPNDPFMWCGSMPPMPPMGPSEPGPIGN